MNHQHPSTSTLGRGATAVITHRVRDGQQEGYDAWLNEIGPLCRSYPGHLDLQIIRPIPGLTATYTVIVRFDTRKHLQGWMSSQDRKRLIERVRPLLVQDDDFFIRSGLDFWFTPEGARAKVPVRWKQFLVTWSAIFPLVLVIPLVVAMGLRQLGVPQNHYLDLLLSTGSVVWVMVYFVMPHYTKLIQRWLFT
ncbi:antibiotic biosynthesis monooxygenase [Candidatus Nitrospira allomarina]|uniref:Antibiotic biosynthesis monooxygenase n=1 Tax=Candidatus Nitrospira allomarina TaxID=3020900 RepID=A0AA96GI98_9BACT|nr:antibiotic biosynthesis monooxygenase [Candidatus Nitrospira allomarina]WNM59418.1 antibiotic biosynthesis monooxygenase [Candidatus Nitrospira allomarina]